MSLSLSGAFRVPEVIASNIAQHLEREIIFCDVKPGARLTEEEVSLRLGISRSPVREAFRLLEGDGLLIRTQRRGVRVAPVSRADLDEVQMCRVELEGLAAAEAALHVAEADIAQLRNVLASLEGSLKRNDVRAYFSNNVAFTTQIHHASANRTLMRILNGIGKQALRYRYIAYAHVPELMKVSLPGNRRILAAIQAHDPVAARKLTEQLIRGSWKAISPYIEATEGSD